MLSRWKLMAGVLGVSLGGLAAAASQCPKFDRSKGRSEEGPVAKAEPKLPPAGAPSAPAAPPKLELPAVPAAPELTPGGATPPALTPPAPAVELPKPAAPAPSIPLPEPTSAAPKIPEPTAPVIPTAGTAPARPEAKPAEPLKLKPATSPGLPPLPDAGKKPVVPTTAAPADPLIDLVPPAPMEKPKEVKIAPKPPKAEASLPPAGASVGSEPVNGVIPQFGSAPPAGVTPPPGKPMAPPAVVGTGGMQPPTASTPDLAPPAHVEPLGVPKGPTTPSVPPAAAGAMPFRIILRVGEGEPTFEVKNGDNLVLKVACDKVDIKSPEKGGGLSEVTARGKVRFAGFGAEGTCDELKFFAGTGEVSMSGEVKVQVKDKLGRVESELTTGSMKYKIDASAVAGQIKP
jgi:hypothetical protein